MDNTEALGQIIEVTIDRPIGTPHPKHPEIIYPINYGYVENLIAGDGEEQDVYILGIDKKLDFGEKIKVKIIGIIHRFDDVEDKWVGCPGNMMFNQSQIEEMTHFQEQFYKINTKAL